MNRYTIYCTIEQVHKAIKLNAPIKECMSRYNANNAYLEIAKGNSSLDEYQKKGIAIIKTSFAIRAYKIPTAEEMIGWLEDKGLLISITALNTPDNPIYNYSINRCEESWKTFSYRKEATITAIDAALDYLTKE